MSNTTTREFGKWRAFFWPIHNFELKKLLPMFLMFFFISFNYTILRDTKDTLIVTAAGSGAEAIPFVKVYGVLPCAVIFMLIYSKLSTKLSKPALFYVTVIPFIVFFALFSTVLYPAREHLHPTQLADTLQALLPVGFKGLIAIFRNWTFSLFYILAELWGSVVLSLLFWGFANDIMRVTEAKRFYALLSIGANAALMVSGPCIMLSSNIRERMPVGVDAWGVTLNMLMGLLVLSGFLVIGIYWWVNRYVLTDTRFYSAEEQKVAKQKRPKMSLSESFLYLTRSKYIGLIAMIVLAYGVTINLVEVSWKNQLKLQFSNPNDYSFFMGGFSTVTGLITVFMLLFVSGNVIRRFGWGVAAQVTPIVLLITGVFFFAFMIFRDSLSAFIAIFGTTPLMLSVLIGASQNIMSKSCKYALFDITKEMSYIPLDQESKVKGKAAIDVVGARLGKSGGSLIQQALIIMTGTISAMAPYIAIVIFAIIAIWMISTKALSKLFVEKTTEKKVEEPVKETVSVS